MSLMSRFFETNQVVLSFIYPLIFFLMGFGIYLKNRVHSRFYLAKSLHYLALFGILHGIADWGKIFIPVQKTYLNDSIIFVLESFQTAINALSFFFLFYFGTHLLQQSKNLTRKILLLPLFFFLIWLGNFLILEPLLVSPQNQEWWFAISDIWARYLLAFPGGLLSGYAMFNQRRQFEEFDVPSMTRTLLIAAVSIGFYAFAAGFIVPYAPVIPKILLNSQYFFKATGFPVEFFRALSGIFMSFFILKILKVFDIEYQMFFYQAEKRKAVTEERNRIARDLHDGMIQSIYAIGLHLEGVRHILMTEREHGADKAANGVQEVIKKLNDLIREIRMYIKELKMPVNKEPRLKEEIERLVKEMNIRQEVEIQFQYAYLGEDPPLSKTVQIFYIVKEALSNVLRHAKASKAVVSICGNEKQLIVQVMDNGIGMEERKQSVNKKDVEPFKQGLRNMESRTKSIGGTLIVKSVKNKGTKILLQVKPVHKARSAENENSNN